MINLCQSVAYFLGENGFEKKIASKAIVKVGIIRTLADNSPIDQVNMRISIESIIINLYIPLSISLTILHFAFYYRYLGPNRSLTVVSRYNLSFLVKVYPSACLSVVACDEFIFLTIDCFTCVPAYSYIKVLAYFNIEISSCF